MYVYFYYLYAVVPYGETLVNIGSGDGMMPDSAKPPPLPPNTVPNHCLSPYGAKPPPGPMLK